MATSRGASRCPRDIANVMQRLQGRGKKFQVLKKFKYHLNPQSVKFVWGFTHFYGIIAQNGMDVFIPVFSNRAMLSSDAVFIT